MCRSNQPFARELPGKKFEVKVRRKLVAHLFELVKRDELIVSRFRNPSGLIGFQFGCVREALFCQEHRRCNVNVL